MELTGAQICELIKACPTEGWQNSVLTMATYGLRPIEVTLLEVRMNTDTNSKQLFCSDQKTSSGRTKKLETAPRFLYPMPARDGDGQERSGDLTAAIDAGLLPFPALNYKEPGETISQYLRRLKLWRQWQEVGKAKGVALKPYSFRNSYSVRCHERGIPFAKVAAAMGHSEKHTKSITSPAATAACLSKSTQEKP